MQEASFQQIAVRLTFFTQRHVGVVLAGRLDRLSVNVVEIVDQLLPEARNRSGRPRDACLVGSHVSPFPVNELLVCRVR